MIVFIQADYHEREPLQSMQQQNNAHAGPPRPHIERLCPPCCPRSRVRLQGLAAAARNLSDPECPAFGPSGAPAGNFGRPSETGGGLQTHRACNEPAQEIGLSQVGLGAETRAATSACNCAFVLRARASTHMRRCCAHMQHACVSLSGLKALMVLNCRDDPPGAQNKRYKQNPTSPETNPTTSRALGTPCGSALLRGRLPLSAATVPAAQ